MISIGVRFAAILHGALFLASVSAANAPVPSTAAAAASKPAVATPAPAPDQTPLPSPPSMTIGIAGADQARSGSTKDAGPERPPAVVWSQPVAANAVTEPIVTVTDHQVLVLLGSGEDVLALDQRTGAPVWRSEMGMLVGASLSIAPGQVFVPGLDGIMRILNPATGATIKDMEVDFTLQSPGLVLGDLLVYEETSVGGGQSKSRLHGMDLATRMDRWRSDYVLGSGRPPSSDGERVYVASSDAVHAFLVTDGSAAWTRSHDPMSRVYGPVVSDGRVIASRGSYGPGIVEALDAKTGKVLWTKETAARLGAPPSVVDGEIFIPLMNSSVARFSAADGAALPAVKTPGRVDVRLVVAPHRIYFAAGKTFGAIDRATLKSAWRLDSDGEVAALAVSGGTLYVARQDGFFDAVESAPAP